MPALGGPEFDPAGAVPASTAALHEFLAMFLLCTLVYAVNWVFSVKDKYFVKQSLTAFGVRAIIETLGAAGPAINPGLATTWAFYKASLPTIVGTGKKATEVAGQYAFPANAEFYYVYWLASTAGALASALAYAAYSGGTFFGYRIGAAPKAKKA